LSKRALETFARRDLDAYDDLYALRAAGGTR
jgi:hypothetical protein